MYCFSCGAKIDDDAIICPKCGDRTDHYHQEKTTKQDPWATTPQYASATPQYAASTTPAYTAPQHYAQTAPQQTAWETTPQYAQSAPQQYAQTMPQQYAQAVPQHFASSAAGGASTLQGPSLQSPSELNVADYNAYRKRMEVKRSGKSKGVALVLCIFFGYLGIHRFYLGKIGTGFVWLFTVGVFLVGWLVDIALIATNSMTDKDGHKI